MASFLSFTSAYQFFPIGNTTAVCLTRDLPPDIPANILLLPCGDPRNILYTLFCEKSNRLRKSLDFTCCDHDPGILARDVLLLTMIMDRVAVPTMWNIFFHMYLDVDSHSTLVSQSQKLAAYVSVEAWRSSPYGAVIKMGSDQTFYEVQRHWELYVDFYHPSKLRRFRTLQQAMDVQLKHQAATAPEDNLTTLRSLGPLFLHSQASSLVSELYRRWWQTGTTFTDKTRLAASTYPNSTFLYSRAGEGFDVCQTTDPMIPFHFAPLFGNSGDRVLTIEDLVDSAQSQFRNWCAAFQTATMAVKSAATRVVIRYILGDVLTVARALQDLPVEKPSTDAVQGHPLAVPRVAPWTTCPMELNREYGDHGSPTRFDVIDTSNVSDYLSMLNLFVITAPLLAASSSSVLYTESFLLFASDLSIEFQAKLPATSLTAVALLTDLAPVDVLSGFTSTCNIHELTLTFLRAKDKDILLQRFTWKRPSSCDPSAYPDGGPRTLVSFDAHQLAKLLHNIYHDMFRSEDPIHWPETIEKALKGHNDAATRVIIQGVIVYPSRESFTAFLRFIRAFLKISEEQWPDVMRSFLDILSSNQPDFDKRRSNDLHAQLYRYRLHTVPELGRVYSPSSIAPPLRLSFWPSIPSLIRVFLIVPRAEFAKLERAGTNMAFNIWLHCMIDLGGEQEQHYFQSVDAAYGTLVDTGTAAAPSLSFREDLDGRKNGADLVFSFVVPSCMLTKPPVTVRLEVRSEPNTMRCLIPALGRQMCVFSANMEDKDYVHLLPEPQLPLLLLENPGQPSSSVQKARKGGGATIGYQPPVRVEMDSTGKQIASLTAKLEITNAAAQAAFASGAMPDVSQRSPCTIQVVLGGRKQILAYPVPIVGSRHKLRLARKSSYIEVVVPLAIPFLEPDGLKVNSFPVVRAKGSLVPWNIHRVFLDQLLVLDRANISDSQLDTWYSIHLTWQNSVRERTALLQNPTHPDALMSIKKIIGGIMMRAAGLGGSPGRVFSLQNSILNAVDTILFVDKVRYDDAAHTMVLDAFVLAEITPHVGAAFPPLFSQGVFQIQEQAGDMGLGLSTWKRLLPALAERCRTTWTHGPNCEYIQPDGSIRIPRELPAVAAVLGDWQGDPLCSCGRGKDVEGMMKNPVWRAFAPYVTRIALSPLFGVSHVEQILEWTDIKSVPQNFDPALAAQPGPPGPASPPSRPPPVRTNGSKTYTSGSNSSGGPGVAVGSAAAPVTMCEKCKKQESGNVKLLQCSRCKVAVYCSQACQKSDWKTHKMRCKN